MCRLSYRHKIFHVFSWNLHNFSWIFHDFPCWPLTTSSVGATRILQAVAQAEGRVGAACASHRPYGRGAISEKAAI